jgi:putative 4-mercaptohistidine N1-methyltranferase
MGNPYETTKLLEEYLLFHYGSAEEILGGRMNHPLLTEALGFPVRTVQHFGDAPAARGLDLGCAVGRSTFEMAGSCAEVIGIDFSSAFISAANMLRLGGEISYSRLEEAVLTTPLLARVPEVPRDRVSFETGDAMNLRDDLGSFDRVHAANLLCRLPEPSRLLERFPQLVNQGGLLVLATPCTWLEEFTPRGNWPPGSTFDWLKSFLCLHFDLVHQTEEPFLIRETARKFQLTFSLLTVWRRH